MGFMHLHISSLGQNIIALFSIIWVKICEKIWVYALARCRGREKSEGEMAGYATRSLGFLQVSNAFPQFVSSSFSITVERTRPFPESK